MPGPGGVAVIGTNGPTGSSVVLADLKYVGALESYGIVRRMGSYQLQVPDSSIFLMKNEGRHYPR
jgi:hypothetical protein